VPSNYSRGRAFEYKARSALVKRGALYVMRAAQSKGIADLLALWPWCIHMNDQGCADMARVWAVQCKFSINGGGYLPGAEARELIELADLTGALPVFARPGPKNRGVEFINLFTKETLA
jgi:hypothetical protein